MADVLSATCQPAVKRQVLNRLHRANGQLESIIAMVEAGGDCRSVVTQLAAVSAAVRRTGYVIVANHMKRSYGSCGDVEDAQPGQVIDDAELEKLFMMLA